MTTDNRTAARHVPGTATGQSPLHRPAGTGATYLGPGDVYRFLVTGAETGGAYFAMEAIVAPGGGPPPHIHRREDETFYILEGECRLLLADEWITAGVGDFINVPRGTGSGFVWDEQGHIVTNMHVIAGAAEATTFAVGEISMGRMIRIGLVATVVFT